MTSIEAWNNMNLITNTCLFMVMAIVWKERYIKKLMYMIGCYEYAYNESYVGWHKNKKMIKSCVSNGLLY